MKNILDYVEKEGIFTFAEKPFCEVDSLVLSQLSYINFSAIMPTDRSLPLKGIKSSDKLFENLFCSDDSLFLFLLTKRSARFGGTIVAYPVMEANSGSEKQFFAVTFILDDAPAYIAFRGTDTTLIGWKEDFNMSFTPHVPAQLASLEYLTRISNLIGGAFYVGGHSKGGNLAVYASVFADEKISDRIIKVYNHDGPGFSDITTLPEEKYIRIKSRIEKTVPESSFIGMLLEQQCEYKIVNCSGFSALQHFPFAWGIKKSRFDYAKRQTKSSRIISETLNKWLCTADTETRKQFVDALFSIACSTGSDNIEDIGDKWLSSAKSVISSLKSTDEETKKILSSASNSIFKMMFSKD